MPNDQDPPAIIAIPAYLHEQLRAYAELRDKTIEEVVEGFITHGLGSDEGDDDNPNAPRH